MAHYGTLPFIDALFTAASAVCVTGLNVVDVGTHFSAVGQFVLLFLIQIGGLGIMTFYALCDVIIASTLFESRVTRISARVVNRKCS